MAPVSIQARWRQLLAAGEVVLDTFSTAELACVSIEPRLQCPGEGQGGSDHSAHELVAAAAELERRGYLRPRRVRGSRERIVPSLAAWAARPPSGDPREPRPVFIAGDLAIIVQMRAKPRWVAEVEAAVDLPSVELRATGWRPVARLHAIARPPAALLESTPGAQGQLPAFALLRDGPTVSALARWCGVAPEPAREGQPDEQARPPRPAPLIEVASQLTGLTRIRVAHHRAGGRVATRCLVAAAGEGRHWLLEGVPALATPVSANQLTERIADVLES